MRVAHTPPEFTAAATRGTQRPDRNSGEARVSAEGTTQAAPVDTRSTRGSADKLANVQAHLEKMQVKIDRVAERISTHLGEDAAAAFVAEIEAVKDAFLGPLLGTESAEGAEGAAPAGPGSIRAAFAHVINTYRQYAQDGAWPGATDEGGEVGEVPVDTTPVEGDPVAPVDDDVVVAEDPVGDDAGGDVVVDPAGDDAGTVIDVGGEAPPDVTLPVIPPEATVPSEDLDVMLLGVPVEAE